MMREVVPGGFDVWVVEDVVDERATVDLSVSLETMDVQRF